MFRLFVDLNQCRHIYFAGCHDTGFGSLLTPYRNRGDRITLIKGASFHREFEELNLPIRELRSVFMSTPLDVITRPSAAAISKVAPTTNGIKPICKHWQKVCASSLLPLYQVALISPISRESANSARLVTNSTSGRISSCLLPLKTQASRYGLARLPLAVRRSSLPPHYRLQAKSPRN